MPNYVPIAYINPQFENYSNWWLKGYYEGTSTPLAMATDTTAATQIARAEIDLNGFIKTAGGDLFIPHFNTSYDLFLFPTAVEADANDTANAIQMADDINADNGGQNAVSVNIVSNETTATAGQTVFSVPGGYVIGAGNIRVVVDGSELAPSDYTETDSNTVTLDTGLLVGQVLVTYVGTTSSTVSTTDASLVTYTYPGGASRAVNSKLNEILHVGDFPGLDPTGVSDSYGAIQAAIDAAELNTYLPSVYLPAGKYLINTGLRISKGIKFYGDGFGDVDSAASQPSEPATEIVSGITGTMLLINAAASGEYVWGCEVSGIYFSGSNTAQRGIRASSCRECIFDVGIERTTVAGLVIDDGNNALSANNRIRSISFQAGSDAATDSVDGVLLQDSGLSIGTTRTQIDYLSAVGGKNGSGLKVRDHDGGYFARVDASVKAGGTGYGVVFDGAGGTQPRPSRKNHIGFLNGTVYGEAGSRNTIGMINSEPSSVTLSGDGIIDYNVIDRNNGARYETFRYKMAESIDIDFTNSYSIAGTAAVASVGATNGVGLNYPDAADSKNGVTVNIPRAWSQGDIASVELTFYADGGTNGQDVVLEAGVASRDAAVGFGSGLVVSGNITVDIPTVSVIQKETISITTPVGDDSASLVVQVERKGTLGNDTLTAGLVLLGVRVNFVADGPHTDAGANYDNPADKQ